MHDDIFHLGSSDNLHANILDVLSIKAFKKDANERDLGTIRCHRKLVRILLGKFQEKIFSIHAFHLV